jgi:methylase of polypeptide subunit release factors
VIERLLSQAARCLRPGGLLLWEFGYDHEDRVRALVARGGWRLERIGEDLQGIPRIAVVSRHEQ